jgi:hypothetical protein
MKCKFTIGQRIMCIKTEPWHSCIIPTLACDGPSHGDIVTITDMVPYADRIFLRLAEWDDQGTYQSDFFKPLTDITIFQKMLRTKELEWS